jgi:ABC-type multidrug transport system fused ATPase/permease subunit
MNKGKIVEQGNHESIIASFPEGIYAKFVREQEQAEV